MLCCFALFVCLTLLASFFLPSHLSFKNMYMYMYIHICTCAQGVNYFYACLQCSTCAVQCVIFVLFIIFICTCITLHVQYVHIIHIYTCLYFCSRERWSASQRKTNACVYCIWHHSPDIRFILPCCLFDLACFFLPSFSHLSLKHVYL